MKSPVFSAVAALPRCLATATTAPCAFHRMEDEGERTTGYWIQDHTSRGDRVRNYAAALHHLKMPPCKIFDDMYCSNGANDCQERIVSSTLASCAQAAEVLLELAQHVPQKKTAKATIMTNRKIPS